MPDSELLPRAAPRSDQPRPAADVEANTGLRETIVPDPASPRQTVTTSSSNSTDPVENGGQPRRPSIWQLPFCSTDTSWLHVSNTLVYFVLFCVNVLVNSEALWPSIRAVDVQHGPILTPAGWAYHMNDLILFLWGLAVAAQSLAEHKGWKEGLLAAIGPSWQLLWYCQGTWLVLHVTASPTGLLLAPLFTLAALLTALATQARLAGALPQIHQELQEEGFEGVPALAYMLYLIPCSLTTGWLLVLHTHVGTLALQVLSRSEQAALTFGCASLILSTVLALLLLLRLGDVATGMAFTWGCVAVWTAGFTTQDTYRPDQLVACFCAILTGLLTYCVVADPRRRRLAVAAGPP